MLAYVLGTEFQSQLTWVDQDGHPIGTVGKPGAYINLGLSADDRRLAVSRITGSPLNTDIWLFDLLDGETSTRLTVDPTAEFDPTWPPDGARVVFNSVRSDGPGAGVRSLYWRPSTPGGPDELLVRGPGASDSDWSSNGRFLAYTLSGDVWVLPFADRKPVPFLQTPFNETNPAFSRDGRWMAYTSNESGTQQIYVKSFPPTAERHQISLATGAEPRWRGDGKEIFFLASDGTMMAAGVDTTNGFRKTAPPRVLFRTGIITQGRNHPYVVTRNGTRFLYGVSEQQAPQRIAVVANWPATVGK